MTKVRVPQKELWRVDEVAKFFDVSAQTIYMWCNLGKLHFVRISNSVRIPREEIIRVMKEE
jgi:excisionase family DNA binding protein